MAQHVRVILTDDLDGGEAAETVKFGLDGTEYEIDLSEANVGKLRDALAPYQEAGRRLARSGKPFRRVPTGPDSRTVRAWAASAGVDCPDRGRVPGRVMEAYSLAQKAIA